MRRFGNILMGSGSFFAIVAVAVWAALKSTYGGHGADLLARSSGMLSLVLPLTAIATVAMLSGLAFRLRYAAGARPEDEARRGSLGRWLFGLGVLIAVLGAAVAAARLLTMVSGGAGTFAGNLALLLLVVNLSVAALPGIGVMLVGGLLSRVARRADQDA